jgi:phosphoribosylglycinamide formyltransferase 2
MVTLISQDLSEFALHVRAFLGLPIEQIIQYGPAASAVILGNGISNNIRFDKLTAALSRPQTQVRLFGKPEINGRRRLGVTLTRREDTKQSVSDAISAAADVKIIY